MEVQGKQLVIKKCKKIEKKIWDCQKRFVH